MDRRSVTVKDIVNIMETIAPSDLAESWDNVGLQVGDDTWPAARVRVALDPLPKVVEQACRNNIDLLITHHPLLFRPLKTLNTATPLGKIIQMALVNQTAIFSAHTNLDSAVGGINDHLAEKLGLRNTTVLERIKVNDRCKLVVYVPKQYEREVSTSLFASGAGKIGAYECCSFRIPGKGTFMPGKEAKPFWGKPGKLNETDEIRLETVVSRKNLSRIIECIKMSHPYETPVYDVYPLVSAESAGLGRIGDLESPLRLKDFALSVKNALGLYTLKVAGDPDLLVEKVAVCSGSGSGLMKTFFNSTAQCYVSGDLHYHDARNAEILKRGLLDIGHFPSEHIVVRMLAEKLKNVMQEKNLDVTVDGTEMENDPFGVL